MTSRKSSADAALPPETGQGPADSDRTRKRHTINDIARLAGVSKKTVSRVINDSPFVKEETRSRVSAIIKEHGFSPDPQAQGLAFRRAFLIGMVYDNPSAQYVVNMQQGILDALKGSSFELVVRPVDRSSAHFLSDMRAFVERQKLFGVVLPPPTSEDEKLIDLLTELNCPHVRIAAVSLAPPRAMVVTHDHLGGVEAARHIAALGHVRIAHISGPHTFRSAVERRRGFVAGLTEKGLHLETKYEIEAAYTFESGVAAGAQLLALDPRPTAIFTGNDDMAAGVYKAARNAGLSIPGDLSIVGFDDSPVAHLLWPLLTSVRLPIRDMGRFAAEKLVAVTPERRVAADLPCDVVPTLVVRESTARPAP